MKTEYKIGEKIFFPPYTKVNDNKLVLTVGYVSDDKTHIKIYHKETIKP